MRQLSLIVACLTVAACSDTERDAAADADGNGSMSAETAGGAKSHGPSTIDCARASGQAEQAVCADKELIAIDRGMGAMSGYAVDSVWVAKRGECSRSDDLRQCLLDLYASRIADLAGGGIKDGGIVVGPISLRCGAEDVSAIFVNSDPGAVHLRLADRRVTLPHVPAASGAKYEGRPDDEAWSFWSKGNESSLIRAGKETQCQELGRFDE
jgi:membrane-bound inhibitor of C-type lysozyme